MHVTVKFTGVQLTKKFRNPYTRLTSSKRRVCGNALYPAGGSILYLLPYMLEASMEMTDSYVKAEMLEFSNIQRT